MEGKKIKELMFTAGITQSEIAKRLGVSISLVNHVINGIRVNQKVREAIAEALGRSVEELWGSNGKNEEIDLELETINKEGDIGNIKDSSEIESNVMEGDDIKSSKEAIVVPINFYYRTTGNYLNKSRATIYRKVFRDNKIVGLKYRGKTKIYLVEVDDPEEIECVEFGRRFHLNKKNIMVSFYVHLPEDIVLAAENYFDPGRFEYTYFMNFLDKKNEEYLRIKLRFDEEKKYVKKKITLMKRDYQRLFYIAKINRIDIRKLIEIAFINFVAFGFRESPGEDGMEPVEINNNSKGGYYETMLSSC